MRLAIVAAKYPYGPKEAYLDRELRALAPHMERIAVFPVSPETRAISYAEIPAEIRRFGLLSPATLAGAAIALATRPVQSLRAVAAVVLARNRARVRVKNLAVVPLGLALGVALRRGGFEHVHAYWLSTPATVAYIAAAVAGIPWSSTAHLWDIYEANALRPKLRSAAFVRAISARGRRDLLAAVPDVPAERIRVLHVGVDVSAEVIAPDAARGGAFRVLCAANLVRKKGHRDLLAGLAAVRARGLDVRCTLAGDGELRSELERAAQALNLGDAVVFRGHVGHDALLDEIRAGRYDAMALTSLELPGGVMEGIPVALMEAMALGLPVITTATGSITELVDDGCGRVVPQGDIDAIADALAQLAGDDALRARLARAAHAKVRAEFDVVQVMKELAALIASPVSVTSERAVGSIRSDEMRSREASDAVWGQG